MESPPLRRLEAFPVRALTAVLPAAALWALVSALSACRLFGGGIALGLELPELPAHWREGLGDLEWVILVPGAPGGGEALRVPVSDAAPRQISLGKTQHQPVLAYPSIAGGACWLRPAAAVFPLDLSADGRSLALSWRRGPAAEILRRLLAQDVVVETLNVPRLCREVDERFAADPWSLDLELAAARLAAGAFRVTDLRARPSRSITLSVGPGLWFLESPFAVPVEVAPETSLSFPEVPLGFHRLLEADRGWVADLWVGEREVLMIMAPPPGRPAGLLDIPPEGRAQ